MAFQKSRSTSALLATLVMAAYGSAYAPVAAAAPYSGSAITLPASIQARNFDTGGQGVGYNELSSGNAGGQYRTNESVDIIASTDTSSGGHVVNKFQSGEWLAYTINVPVAGKYDIAVKAANNYASGQPAFRLQLDGGSLSGSVPVPNTGGWDNFVWVNVPGLSLPAGQHVLRLVADAQYFDVSALYIQASGTAPVPTTGTPYTGTPIGLPRSFEAENFNKGGQGVGYNDATTSNSGGGYRPGEGVDIVASTDSAGGGWVVTNVETGEWLAYTVNIPAAGKFDVGVRAAHNYAGTPAFHVELNGKPVSGSVAIPKTGSWDTYDRTDAKGLDLPAGTHELRIVADAQYFNLNTIRVQPTGTTSGSTTAGTPYSGTPIALPLAFEAEHFDRGGQGVAYNDLTSANIGGAFRTGEAVDIGVSDDPEGGGYIINNFHTGEWLTYTVNVPANGTYDLSIRASNNGSTTGAFHIEVDGVDVTGRVGVANTGAWNNYAWFGKQGVALTAGKHVLKLVSDAQYFNVNRISVLRAGTSTSTSTSPITASIPASGVAWKCDFEGGDYCGLYEQSKVYPGRRSSMVSTARSGSTGVMLTTLSGDNTVNGSGTWERNDLSLGTSPSYCNEGQEEWWGHSVLFPASFVFPPGPEAGIVFDFHNSGSTGQANFEIQTIPGMGLRLRGYGGSSCSTARFETLVADPYGVIKDVARDRWYDFNYHVKWSSGSDGYFVAWLNGRKIMNYNGPTLYTGQTCYLKLANYHAPYGKSSSVVHDRVIRGTSASAVSAGTLE